jgi:hypothetical protein
MKTCFAAEWDRLFSACAAMSPGRMAGAWPNVSSLQGFLVGPLFSADPDT